MNEITPDPVAGKKARRIPWRLIFLLAVVGVIVLLAWIFDVVNKLAGLREWMAALGGWGPMVFGLVYAGIITVGLPTAILTALAGGLFGSIVGTITVSAGSTVGISLAFLISRYIARGAMENWLSGSERFQKLDRLTAEHGAIMVALSRLVPIVPCPMVNYGFGLTKVPFPTFVFYSWLCRLPGQIVMVVGFDAILTGLREGRVPWVLVGVVVVVGAFLMVIVRRTRRKLSASRLGAADTGPQ
ncbi:MAG: TVP38/TMEM64 family protein [Proteobacteria bacterium]|nr:TVP38/TMEM64 family protein [Pseudomonadota bacterium]MBU1740556.1 TVP38/TMEM64 family protein [Pseudomonadota bacterium]